MQSIFDQGPPPPCPAPFNLARHVLTRAGAPADKIALAELSPRGATRLSYGALTAAVRGTATGLLSAGAAPGGRVLMRLGSTVDFPIAYLGAIAAGLVPVPASPQLTVPEITAIAEEIRPALILHAQGVSLPRDCAAPVLDTAALRAMRDLPAAPWDMGDPDRCAYILYTSGTSGRPRAVMHAHRAIWARQMMIEGWYGMTASDRLLHAGAFNWSFTLGTGLMDPWTCGATALIPAEGTAPEALPLLLRRHGATIFAAAPGVFRKMLKPAAPLDLPALRHGLTAGEKLPAATAQAWHAATGTGLFEAYGMSECSTFISAAPGHPAPEGALGYPQTGRRIAILGADGGPLPLGETGTIAVSRRDPGLMLGYLDAPGETASRLRGEWFVTGDQGHMDASGAIFYHGRDDDMMNAGGFRVSPLEVEAALTAHPAIHEAAAVELSPKEGVSVIAAFYVSDAPIPEADLAEFASGRLARYKQPRIYQRVEALPRGGNGKIDRKSLRSGAQTANG